MIHQLCALVVKRNRVLSVGYNSRKTHPKMRTRMEMLHAECDAIRPLTREELCGADLVVVRLRPSGLPGLAKPCCFCEQTLRDSGIRRVYYTDTEDQITLKRIDLRD